jgi:hypothetical protein
MFIGGLVLLVAGFGLMLAAYRKFRCDKYNSGANSGARGEKGLFDMEMMKDVYRSLETRSMEAFDDGG